MRWMLMPLNRYVDFKGRSRRSEYWMFMLLVLAAILLAGVAMIIVKGSFRTQGDLVTAFTTSAGLALVPLIVPLIAVTVRRLHDLGLSGWWLVALPIGAVIPAIDAIVPFAHVIAMALPGRKGANRFGEDPQGGHDARLLNWSGERRYDGSSRSGGNGYDADVVRSRIIRHLVDLIEHAGLAYGVPERFYSKLLTPFGKGANA